MVNNELIDLQSIVLNEYVKLFYKLKIQLYAYVEYMGIRATFSSFYILNILFSPFTDLHLLADVLNKNNGFQVAVLFYLEFGKLSVNIFKRNVGLYKNSFFYHFMN